ncbi:regucalcin-like [Ciona intestinalis]
MSSVKVELVHNYDCQLGEGPHWDDQTQTLLFVDIDNSAIHRWNPATKQTKTTIVKDSSIGAVVPRKSGGLMIAAGHRFASWNENTGESETFKEVNLEFPTSRFNDGKCDPVGRFWAGTMGRESAAASPDRLQGKLYCLDIDHSVRTKVYPVDISNGLSWTSNVMYYCDSLKLTIDAYDYDVTTGDIKNMREVVKFDREKEGVPDGHCIDTDGNLWVAMFFTGQVIKVDPRTGEKLQYVKVSDIALKTTSVCFGGPNLDEMYVTSARNKPLMEPTENDISGALFKASG